eukprot:9503993-Pyramimonas_sp.AAC.1
MFVRGRRGGRRLEARSSWESGGASVAGRRRPSAVGTSSPAGTRAVLPACGRTRNSGVPAAPCPWLGAQGGLQGRPLALGRFDEVVAEHIGEESAERHGAGRADDEPFEVLGVFAAEEGLPVGAVEVALQLRRSVVCSIGLEIFSKVRPVIVGKVHGQAKYGGHALVRGVAEDSPCALGGYQVPSP